MVAGARALMPEPSTLLLDEPSAELAPMLVDSMFAQVSAINREGIAILMVEQGAQRFRSDDPARHSGLEDASANDAGR